MIELSGRRVEDSRIAWLELPVWGYVLYVEVDGMKMRTRMRMRMRMKKRKSLKKRKNLKRNGKV